MSRVSPRNRVLQWLESAISSGELPRGAEVPSERTLAARLGVSRNTVAAAMDIAERRRLVCTHSPTGRKRFVASDATASSPLSAATVVVLGEMDPFRPDGAADAPRWSNRYLSLELLARLSAAGKHVMLLNHATLSDDALRVLFTTRFAGMAVLGTVSEFPGAKLALDLCAERGIPTVSYGNYPGLDAFDHVYSDHRAGSRDLTRWLLSQGRRDIHVFYPDPLESCRAWTRRRYEGYCDAMAEAGLAPNPYIAYIGYDDSAPHEGEKFRLHRAVALERLLLLQREGVPFDALLCITDHWAKAVMSALRELGLRPNRDVYVAGYDNILPDPSFDGLEPECPIATIDKHNERTAETMAELLLDRLADRLPPEPQTRVLPHELVIRPSSPPDERK